MVFIGLLWLFKRYTSVSEPFGMARRMTVLRIDNCEAAEGDTE
jgi:hypothetical protein